MKIKTNALIVPEEAVLSRIYRLREVSIMLDKDLALLYGVKPIRLREQVKRNKLRFPENFMFQLTKEEADTMVSQNAIPSKKQMGGALPYAFTDHGVLMLANVLRSKQAIDVSVRIVEIFVKLRKMTVEYTDIKMEIESIWNKLHAQGKNIELVFSTSMNWLKRKKMKRPAHPSDFIQTQQKNSAIRRDCFNRRTTR